MPKPIVRIVFSVLIALILVAGVYTSVHGLLLNASINSKRAQASTHLVRVNQSLLRGAGDYGADPNSYGRSEHDCSSESEYDPADD